MTTESSERRTVRTFRVKFETTKGAFLVDVYRDWAPHAVDRFHHLVRIGFFDDCAFFKVTPQMAQFGITGEEPINLAWLEAYLPADAPKQSNRRGFVSFAGSSPEKRTTQVFVNRTDNTKLDRQFPPIGQVVGNGMEVVDALYAAGDGPPDGPVPGRIIREGKAYLSKDFPKLDSIKRASIAR